MRPRLRRDDVLVPEFSELVPRTRLKVPERKPVSLIDSWPRLDPVPRVDELVPEIRGSHRRANAAGVGWEPADQ
jgi:hypothetical protein